MSRVRGVPEYAGKVTATVSLPSNTDGPPLVFTETERLGYIPLTLEQAAHLAET